ncbi:MAG: sigma-70 family RNA polymerase sigma factor [Lewinellaceae bacterium]|nr:sigma-70 family RNA polymerase sigma factor [Lewinellaceae bacterium]
MNETKNGPPKHSCTNEEALAWLREGSFELENKVIEYLYLRLLGMIRPWIYSKNGTSEDAHDAVTAAVIKFVRNFREGKYREQGKLEHYLFRIAQRKFFDLLRERGEEKSIEESFSDGIPPEIEGEEDLEEKAEQEVKALARQRKLEHCLGQIGERCKERIMRFWYISQSHKEIAEAMGDASPDVSKAMKNKCQGKLEKCMKN